MLILELLLIQNLVLSTQMKEVIITQMQVLTQQIMDIIHMLNLFMECFQLIFMNH